MTLGDLILRIAPDTTAYQQVRETLTGSQQGLQDLADTAESSSAQLDAAVAQQTAALANLAGGLSQIPDEAKPAGDSVDELAQQMSLFDQQIEETSQAAQQLQLFDVNSIEAADTAFGSLEQTVAELPPPLDDAKEHSEGFKESLMGMLEALGMSKDGVEGFAEKLIELGEIVGISVGLEEIVRESLDVYAATQTAEVGIAQLTGSLEKAEELIGQIKTMAQTEPFAFPEMAATAQRLTAFLGDTEKVPAVLQAAADASAATGNGFDAVASALGRVALTGQVSNRQLVQLGLSWSDIATSMGTSVAQAQADLKKGGQDAKTDLDDLLAAVNAKMGGAAAAQAQTIAGQFIILKNQVHLAMDNIGEELAPVASAIMDLLENAIVPLAEGIGSVLKPAFVEILEAGLNYIQALRDMTTAAENAWHFLESGAATLKDTFGFIQDIASAWQALSEKIGGLNIGKMIADQILPTTQLFSLMAAAIDLASGKQEDALKALQLGADANTKAQIAAKAHADAEDGLSESTQKASKSAGDSVLSAGQLIEKHGELVIALQKAQQALADVKAASDGTADSAQLIAKAQAQVSKILDELNPKLKKHVEYLQEVKDSAEPAGKALENLGNEAGKLPQTFEAFQNALALGFNSDAAIASLKKIEMELAVTGQSETDLGKIVVDVAQQHIKNLQDWAAATDTTTKVVGNMTVTMQDGVTVMHGYADAAAAAKAAHEQLKQTVEDGVTIIKQHSSAVMTAADAHNQLSAAITGTKDSMAGLPGDFDQLSVYAQDLATENMSAADSFNVLAQAMENAASASSDVSAAESGATKAGGKGSGSGGGGIVQLPTGGRTLSDIEQRMFGLEPLNDLTTMDWNEIIQAYQDQFNTAATTTTPSKVTAASTNPTAAVNTSTKALAANTAAVTAGTSAVIDNTTSLADNQAAAMDLATQLSVLENAGQGASAQAIELQSELDQLNAAMLKQQMETAHLGSALQASTSAAALASATITGTASATNLLTSSATAFNGAATLVGSTLAQAGTVAVAALAQIRAAAAPIATPQLPATAAYVNAGGGAASAPAGMYGAPTTAPVYPVVQVSGNMVMTSGQLDTLANTVMQQVTQLLRSAGLKV